MFFKSPLIIFPVLWIAPDLRASLKARREFPRRQVAECGVRTNFVVVGTEEIGGLSGFGDRAEEILVGKLVANPTVERFDFSI